MGQPYQTELAKSPALYEGVDLMLISAVTGRFLDPIFNYDLMISITLAFNGWVAGGMVLRLTRSCYWAVLALVLITLHYEPLGRAQGHLHLFKYGWLLLAVWAFSRFLDSPSPRRGVLLGLAAALVLQGSFYSCFFLMVAFGCWWVGCLAAGRLSRRHLLATCAGGTTFALLGAAVTFPVWTLSRWTPFTDTFFKRSPYEVWIHSAELWQYFCSPQSMIFNRFIEGLQEHGVVLGEWGLFLGYTVILAIGLYVVARLRGRELGGTDPRMLDRLMGLMAIFVLLSLRGGPAVFLFEWVSGFRCYARSGALARALMCIAGPVILCTVVSRLRPKVLGMAAVAGVTALVVFDVSPLRGQFCWILKRDDPSAWSQWLARQPADVRLAAFAPSEQADPLYKWGIANAYPRTRHKHATLNGCDFRLLEADLNLLGASYQEMNQDGLRFVVSLGYETLAFHRDYLKAHPWIGSLPWLEQREAFGDWLIYRANSRMPRFPDETLEGLLAEQPVSQAAVEVPPGQCITGQLVLDRTVVVRGSPRVEIAWADDRGHLVSRPVPALYQHVFGPDLPAYTVRSPKNAGNYRLVVLDSHRRQIASKPYAVVAELRTSYQVFGMNQPGYTVNATVLNEEACRGDHVRVVLENASPFYLQAHTARDVKLGSARSHPGMAAPAQGSIVLSLDYMHGEAAAKQVNLILPQDLPAHGRLEMDVPIEWHGGGSKPDRVRIMPHVTAIGEKVTERGEVHVRILDSPIQSAREAGSLKR